MTENTSATAYTIVDCDAHGSVVTYSYDSATWLIATARDCEHAGPHTHEDGACWVCCERVVIDPSDLALSQYAPRIDVEPTLPHNYTGIDGRCVWCDVRRGSRHAVKGCVR